MYRGTTPTLTFKRPIQTGVEMRREQYAGYQYHSGAQGRGV